MTYHNPKDLVHVYITKTLEMYRAKQIPTRSSFWMELEIARTSRGAWNYGL